MLNRKISEKLTHTLELKIFRQDGVDSINFTRPWVPPFWISSIQVNVTLGCYNNPQKTCKSYFFSITKLFFCSTNITIICLIFFKIKFRMLTTSVSAQAWRHNTLLTSTSFVTFPASNGRSSKHTFCFALKHGYAVKHIILRLIGCSCLTW
jgi:hypothetical protein